MLTQIEERKELEAKRTPCEVWSRVVGYMRPIQSWNPAKRVEYDDRKEFLIDKEFISKNLLIQEEI